MSEKAPAAMNNYRDNGGRTHAHLLGGHTQATLLRRGQEIWENSKHIHIMVFNQRRLLQQIKI